MLALGASGLPAECRHVARREVPPPDEHGRQRLADLAGTKPQQPIAAAVGEGLAEPRGHGLIQGRRVGRGLAKQVTMRGEAEAERDYVLPTVTRKGTIVQAPPAQSRYE